MEHTFEQDTKTAKAIEESLVMELAEVEARYTACALLSSSSLFVSDVDPLNPF